MISILMPLYNGIEFLDDSIGSVINQTYSNWELLIGINGIDIGSDAHQTIKNKIAQYHDNRIIVIDNLEKGKSKTLNILIGLTKYDIICLLDADDIWLPTKLNKQLFYIWNYDIVGSNSEYFGELTGDPHILLGELSRDMFSFQNPVISSAAMLKKSGVHWDEAWEGMDDYNLWIDLLNAGKTFFNIPEVLINHRIHQTSYFNNKNEELHWKLVETKLGKLSEAKLRDLGQRLDDKRWIL
jgi:glycosyltransferase involved in cell wall biosynthesis